jgi:plasmid stabilization system protein ParE
MAKKIVWSDLAVDRFELVVQYLLKEWTEKEAIKFLNQVDTKLFLLSHFPNIGRGMSHNNSIRQIFLSKHNRLIYKIEKANLVILDIFDTRQKEINNL